MAKPVEAFIVRVCSAFSAARLRYAVVGGYAVALHGAVRGTIDVDIVVPWTLASLRKAERALTQLGLVSRLPVGAEEVFRFRDEYIANRNLVAWSFYNPTHPAEQVDIVITYDLRGKRARRVATADGPLQILGRRELIAMKRASCREQDLADADALERLG